MWFFSGVFLPKKLSRMTKVNVSSNSSLIYRKLVNYGYLFVHVSTKYEIQKSQSFTRALQQTVAKNIQTFITY